MRKFFQMLRRFAALLKREPEPPHEAELDSKYYNTAECFMLLKPEPHRDPHEH